MSNPIELYFWPTPNGYKISIALEEMGLPYEVKLVNIGAGDQFKPEFLRFSPNNRMPAIIDPEGPDGAPISVFESGAILQYLARKTGTFYGVNARSQVEVEEWLMWQMGGVGPMAGQANHFITYAPTMDPPQVLPYAQTRYRREVARLYGVLDKRLRGREFVAGDYSIADMALFPWVRNWEKREQTMDDKPDLLAWHDRIAARPAVARALEIAKNHSGGAPSDREAQKLLFGTFDNKN